MTTSNVKLTMDTSSANSGLQNTAKEVDKLNNSLLQTAELSGKMSDINLAVSPGGGVQSGAYSGNVTQALNTVTQTQQQVQQVMQSSSSSSTISQAATGTGGNGGGGMNTLLTAVSAGGGITKVLSALGPAGLAISAAIGGGLALNKLSNQWNKASDVMDLYAAYGSKIDEQSAEDNSKYMRDLFSQVADMRAASGTKYKFEEYMKNSTALQRYGFSDVDSALNATDEIFRWQNFGAGSRDQLNSFAGLTYRFGMGDRAIQSAYAALEASGMQKGQFDEFLSSMEDILESGISKGFVKAAEDVVGELTLLESLSGGSELWKGQYGAEKLSKMNSALENATGLGSVNDVLLYKAMNGLTDAQKTKILGSYDASLGYINNMMLLERGINTENIGAIFGVVDEQGGSKADKIARYANMFGVNYTTAKQIYDMSETYKPGTEASVMAEIEKLKKDPQNQSLEQQYLNTMQSIEETTIEIAGNLYDLKAGLLGTGVDEQGETAAVVDTNYPAFGGTDWVNGKEISERDQFAKMIQNYRYGGKGNFKNKEELYAAMNLVFEDPDMVRMLDVQNIQYREDLVEAWQKGKANDFLNGLLGKGDKTVSTSFGYLTEDEYKYVMDQADSNGSIKTLLEQNVATILNLAEQMKELGIQNPLQNNAGMSGNIERMAQMLESGKIQIVLAGH